MIFNYLDEEIKFEFDGFVCPKTGTYNYVIKDNVYDKVLFNGNLFLMSGDTSVSVPINDIIENDMYKGHNIALPLFDVVNDRTDGIKEFYGTLTIGDDEFDSADVSVIMAYRYPNRKSYLDTYTRDYYDDAEWALDLIQGSNQTTNYKKKENGLVFPPRIPYVSTDNYGIGFNLEVPYNTEQEEAVNVDVDMCIAGDYSTNDTTLSLGYPASMSYYKLSSLYNGIYKTAGKTYPLKSVGNVGWSRIDAAKLYRCQITGAPDDINVDVYVNNVFVDSFNVEHSKDIQFSTSYNGATAIMLSITEGAAGNSITFIIDGTPVSSRKHTYNISVSYNKQQGYAFIFDNSMLAYEGEEADETAVYVDNKLMAKIDFNSCHRYYLEWVDRLGGIQSQPFCGIDTFSESITSNNAISYNNIKRVANKTIAPKWKIQTGWIDDVYMPFYESIFTSPQLLLYDMKEDKSYNVLVTDTSYTEKTKANQQHKLFNLELNIEENKTQIMRY